MRIMGHCLLVVRLIAFVVIGVTSNSTSSLTRSELVNKLLGSEHYDSRVPPNFNNDRPLEVLCGIYINSMDSINESSMDYAMSIFLRQHWTDPRLAFEHLSNETVLMLDARMLKQLWVPDLYFSNEKDSHFHEVMVPNTFIRLHSDGSIVYSARVSLVLACPMVLHKFPLDSQFCKMNIETYAYSIDKLIFKWINETPVEFSPDMELPQFQFVRHSVTSFLKNYSTGQFSGLQIRFHLRRDIGFYMIQTYVPSVLVVILSWVSFWISTDAVPARISLGVLTVLTMTTQSSGIASSLPRVSYVKAIDVWMSTCLVFVFAALLEFAVVNVMSRKEKRSIAINTRAPYRGGIEETTPMLIKSNEIHLRTVRNGNVFTNTETATEQETTPNSGKACSSLSRCCKTCGCPTSDFVDQMSRTLFPFAFILFNMIYWLVYHYWQDVDASLF